MNLCFVKNIYVDGRKLPRNGRKMAIFVSSKFWFIVSNFDKTCHKILSKYKPTIYTVTESADFGFIPDNSTTLTPPGSPGVSREAKLSTEFEFGSLVR